MSDLKRLRAAVDESMGNGVPPKASLAAERAETDRQLAHGERVTDVARQMRAAQRQYFRHRDYAALHEAQRLERELDTLLTPQTSLPGLESRDG